jgi:hypothetical protein
MGIKPSSIPNSKEQQTEKIFTLLVKYYIALSPPTSEFGALEAYLKPIAL